MANIPDLWPVIPSAGVLGLLAWLIIHIMRQSRDDRSDYAGALAAIREQNAAEIKRLTERHDEQIKDLRNEVSSLRSEVADMRAQLEAERKARWEAEDSAARYRRQLIGEPPDGA